MNQKQLALPADEIGWSDESFDLALRFVMCTANLSEVKDMQLWLLENVKQDFFGLMVVKWHLGEYSSEQSYLLFVISSRQPCKMLTIT